MLEISWEEGGFPKKASAEKVIFKEAPLTYPAVVKRLDLLLKELSGGLFLGNDPGQR